MKRLSQLDLKTFEKLVQLNKANLLSTLKNLLEKNYETVEATRDYVFAVGDIPIALIAHVDTVFPAPPKDNVYYDTAKGVMWSPDGLGADDRAGVFAILKIIAKGYRPHIIFTQDEEVGGVGAAILADRHARPFADMKYIIQLDRRGTSDCVFYSCDNPRFVEYVESFGFIEAYGTFSDISEICPRWKVAGVNLSIGYFNEHSISETLHVQPFLTTVSRVCKMLDDVNNSEKWEYIPSAKSTWFEKYYSGSLKNYNATYYDSAYDDSWYDLDDYNFVPCYYCNRVIREYESHEIQLEDGREVYCCLDCIPEAPVNWCDWCGQAFEFKDLKHMESLCPHCRKKGKDNKSWNSYNLNLNQSSNTHKNSTGSTVETSSKNGEKPKKDS